MFTRDYNDTSNETVHPVYPIMIIKLKGLLTMKLLPILLFLSLLGCSTKKAPQERIKSPLEQKLEYIEQKFGTTFEDDDPIRLQYRARGSNSSYISDTISKKDLSSYDTSGKEIAETFIVYSAGTESKKIKDGPYIRYKNSDSYSIKHYKNNRKDSLWITYRGVKDPVRFDTATYKAGKLHGLYAKYHHDGKVNRENYVNGTRQKMQKEEVRYSEKELIRKFANGLNLNRHPDLSSHQYKEATKHHPDTILNFAMSRIADDLRSNSIAEQQFGALQKSESFPVSHGCSSDTLRIFYYTGVTILQYDTQTHIKMDLQQESSWMSRNNFTVSTLSSSLGTPYDADGSLLTYLSFNAGCAVHEEDSLCYYPSILMQFENEKPKWLFLSYFMSC